MPIKVTYFYGRDITTDGRDGALVTDITKKLAAIDVLRHADYGGVSVSGMDRVQVAQKIDAYTAETAELLDSLRSFEVF